MQEKFVIIISDCHLSAGEFFEGKLNPYEDFRADEAMCQFLEHFSSGKYGDGVEVELFINGDFLDFLNVPYDQEFVDVVTESIALYKCQAIMQGHNEVMESLRRFANLPGKSIVYLIGNHDADLFFPSVAEMITRAWDPQGKYPSEKVRVINDTDRVRYPGGVEIHHGNQFEAVHVLDFKEPILKNHHLAEPILNLPWGSLYVLKIINQLKAEREYLDKVRPVRIFVLFGFFIDTFFTLKFVFLSFFYFIKTRLSVSPTRQFNLKLTKEMISQSGDFFQDLERAARSVLDQDRELQTIIFGHTHKPMRKVYSDGKQYINTGTWTKMINLDLRSFGATEALTFVLMKIKSDQTTCELRRWSGESGPHQVFRR